MDFDKFLGSTVTEQIIKDYGLDKILTDASTNNVEETSNAEKASLANVVAPPSVTDPHPVQSAAGTNLVISAGTNAPPTATTSAATIALQSSGSNSDTLLISTSPQLADPTSISDTNMDVPDPGSFVFPTGIVDFSQYANIDVLGDGEAKQKLRKFEDDLQSAQKELGQAKATLEGTKRLFDKQFVTKTDLTRDQLSTDSAELKVQTAETRSRRCS